MTAPIPLRPRRVEEAIPADWLELITCLNLDPEEEGLLLDLDGALALLVQHITTTAHRPQPWLALGTSLAALGALMGHRYRSETNLRSNVSALCLAPSSAGKDHARQVIKAVFIAAGREAYLGGERLASGAGLMSALHRHPSLLFQIDEFGKFAAAICDRRAPKHIAEVWDRLTELATSAGGTWLGTEYADQKEHPREKIVQPCCCLHATSVHEPFWAALQSGAKFDGSLARFLLFETRSYPDTRHDKLDAADVPAELIEALQEIAPPQDGLPGSPLLFAEQIVVPMSSAARAELVELDADITHRLRRGKENRAVLGRWCEHTIKLAMIAAASANPAEPMIETRHFEWAGRLVQKAVEDLLYESEEHIADNDVERNVKLVLGKVREAGRGGITTSELIRKTQALNSKERNSILFDLVESDAIKAHRIEHTGAGRPGHRYFFRA